MSTTQAPPAVETHALTRRFGDVCAVDRLDLTIAVGRIFGLLGPNGAGKTTSIKMLTTLLPPTEGSAVVAGFDIVRQAAAVRRRIGYVPQLLSADAALTGEENLELSGRLYGLRRAERRERIDDALAFMGLEHVRHALVSTYSGGMVRRLELAQALLHHPAVLFLDEPTVGLDPLARRAVWERLQESRRRFAMTIVLTTHDMEEADVLCDELAIMHGGRLAARGSPAELKAAIGEHATLDDVFLHFAGGVIEAGGNIRDIEQTRRLSTRLG
ncbi:MAG TPA: ATP-binding cassette domain-containing protein [Gemmatimonadaceae bacterium]|jgi:ABC-2 type transport system ATP-binding protein|nr:ATP-binding cassette domain-containing protein [Gemmatimonadaceae bacterium]